MRFLKLLEPIGYGMVAILAVWMALYALRIVVVFLCTHGWLVN